MILAKFVSGLGRINRRDLATVSTTGGASRGSISVGEERGELSLGVKAAEEGTLDSHACARRVAKKREVLS
jgi:hypothetical protein